MKRPLFAAKFFIFLAFALFSANCNICLAAGDKDKQAQNYLETMKAGNSYVRIDTLKRIERSRPTSEALFDYIEKELLAKYQDMPDDKLQIDEMSWLCKALASSGMAKYRAALETVAENAVNPKLKKHALQGVEIIDVASRGSAPADASPEVAQLMKMLTAGDMNYKRDAAKKAAKSVLGDQRLYDAIESELLKAYENGDYSKEGVDAMAWMCKALAASGNEKYQDSLTTIADNASNPKLKKYASQSLAALMSQ